MRVSVRPGGEWWREVVEHYRDVIKERLLYVAELSKTRARELVADAIEESPEYKSVLSGQLREHFGLTDPEYVLTSVSTAVVASVRTRVIAEGFGGIVTEILSDDFSELLDLSGTTYVSNGHDIDWLKWLLFEGDKIIISGFHLDDSRPRQASRTGQAIMVERGSWGVPSWAAGTAQDNFLTRALADVGPKLIYFYKTKLIGRY